jgi:hypothetical protein
VTQPVLCCQLSKQGAYSPEAHYCSPGSGQPALILYGSQGFPHDNVLRPNSWVATTDASSYMGKLPRIYIGTQITLYGSSHSETPVVQQFHSWQAYLSLGHCHFRESWHIWWQDVAYCILHERLRAFPGLLDACNATRQVGPHLKQESCSKYPGCARE